MGNWFVVGTNSVNDDEISTSASTTQTGFLSQAWDYLDPSALILSTADFQGQPNQFVVTNNVDWTTITPARGGREGLPLVSKWFPVAPKEPRSSR